LYRDGTGLNHASGRRFERCGLLSRGFEEVMQDIGVAMLLSQSRCCSEGLGVERNRILKHAIVRGPGLMPVRMGLAMVVEVVIVIVFVGMVIVVIMSVVVMIVVMMMMVVMMLMIVLVPLLPVHLILQLMLALAALRMVALNVGVARAVAVIALVVGFVVLVFL
jgi:hypothetical protein